MSDAVTHALERAAVLVRGQRDDAAVNVLLLRPRRWWHLATLLQARQEADPWLRAILDDELRTWRHLGAHTTHGPDHARRQVIEALLPDLDGDARRWIEFVLRTAA